MPIKSAKAALAGVVGYPVSHSLSPLLHNYWLEKYGIDGAYMALPLVCRLTQSLADKTPADAGKRETTSTLAFKDSVAFSPVSLISDARDDTLVRENFKSSIMNLLDMGFKGVNVTLPYKEYALDISHEADDAAARIKAANTLVFRDGKILAYNTDASGFLVDLKANFPNLQADGAAVILGAGGAAKAVAYALELMGYREIYIVSRSKAKAEEIPNTQHVDWNLRGEALNNCALLVNCTSLGMKGAEALEIPLEMMKPDSIVYDIIYNPLQTQLVKAALGRGHPAANGLGMLINQAVPGFKMWYGVDKNLEDDFEEISRMLSSVLSK